MKRFTIVPGNWYAMEFIMDSTDEVQRWYSPVKVQRFSPRQSGGREFDLAFFHAAYPAGVQNKVYPLRTLFRTQSFMIAEHLDEPERRMTVLLHALSARWLKIHFNITVDNDADLQAAMENETRGYW
ncbi:hypothetical protein KQI65_09805 [bacterium]|nr:hypothetical protein [bacterium]